jgi:hypothetical protein
MTDNNHATETMEANAEIDGLALAALAYLALPTLLFELGWLTPLAGIPLCLATLAGLAYACKQAPARGRLFGPIRMIVWIILLAALIWTSLGGAGHFVFANFDWHTRDAVLRDLTLYHWPPSYGEVEGYPVILRCPLGYYLPAALMGKLFGVASADFFLWLWTCLGVGLFLLLLPLSRRSWPRAILGLLVVVLFSGMDWAGWKFLYADFMQSPEPTDHLEWWARAFQYSSHSTQLFWVPNHALPAWIGGALFLRHWRAPEFLSLAPMTMATVALWSPFAFIGLAPFMALPLYRAAKEGGWPALKLQHWPLALLTFGASLLYLTLDTNRIPGGAALDSETPSFIMHLMDYAVFVVFEFAILAFALWRLKPSAPLLMAVAILLLLPLRRFGPGNDLVMRASIPALLVLCAAALQVIEQGVARRRWGEAAILALVLSVGAVTPMHEILRATLQTAWSPNLNGSLLDIQGGRAPAHYAGRLDRPALAAILNSPDPVARRQ